MLTDVDQELEVLRIRVEPGTHQCQGASVTISLLAVEQLGRFVYHKLIPNHTARFIFHSYPNKYWGV